MEDEYAQGNEHVKPNVQTYTSLIDAYAKNRDADAAKRAETTLNRMGDDGMLITQRSHLHCRHSELCT
jgi:pentatricopeptide repeat protein